MQITRLLIENFKGIDRREISFLEEGTNRPRPLTVLLGDNGSGKTTVLQAIALVLSLATGKTKKPPLLSWPGFMAERVSSRGPTRVELDVRIEQDELQATQELFSNWPNEERLTVPAVIRLSPPLLPHDIEVRLTYENGFVKAHRTSSPSGAVPDEFLLRGRSLIRDMAQVQPQWGAFSQRVGDVFWFDQNRNLTSVGNHEQHGLERLRESLVGWWGVHTSQRRNGTPDYLERLQKRFAEIFPGTTFEGLAPRSLDRAPSAADFYFLLKREGRVYDLAEMSSGEQAVFPLLYEFVWQNIARSVVLIDELELHLHPPQQQALLSALRHIGPDCQFIVTSHSPYLETVVPDEDEVRLPGGQRCL
jgi:predicted ATPase